MSLQQAIVGQFRNPHGAMGVLAGWIMANRSSNSERNGWTIAQLGLEDEDHVLEIGSGPGAALKLLHTSCPTVRAVGIDPSPVMVRQARSRNAEAVRSGQFSILQGKLETADLPVGSFDAAYCCNVVQFIERRGEFLDRVRHVLRPGGRLAISFQPRGVCATAEEGRRWIADVAEDLCSAGFADVSLSELDLKPVPAFCALGVKP